MLTLVCLIPENAQEENQALLDAVQKANPGVLSIVCINTDAEPEMASNFKLPRGYGFVLFDGDKRVATLPAEQTQEILQAAIDPYKYSG